MFKRLFGGRQWDTAAILPPWGNRPSIYQWVLDHLSPDGIGLIAGGETLPDEEIVMGGHPLRWVAGAMDGCFGSASSDAETIAREIVDALAALFEQPTSARAATLYRLLVDHSALGYIDALLPAVAYDPQMDAGRLSLVARWFATEAADREAVKASIALLGLLKGAANRDLFLALGRHEEFTLYAAVALLGAEPDPDPMLWSLAKSVRGWGRIQTIQRLRDTQSPAIKRWLLREGYENTVMREYTALICAQTGDLAGELRAPNPDDALLRGAAAILEALVLSLGGPAEGIDEYAQGAKATELYLRHLQSQPLDLAHFATVNVIDDFLRSEEASDITVKFDWQERQSRIQYLISQIQAREWAPLVEAGLKSDDRHTFWLARRGAIALDMDVWHFHFERVQRGEDDWYFVSETDDPARMAQLVSYAEATLPLAQVATGPAEELGLGPAHAADRALDYILQGLRRFPGLGWPLVEAGLRSKVIRTRNGAARVIGEWPVEKLPPQAKALLRAAWAIEPNASARELMAEVRTRRWGPIE